MASRPNDYRKIPPSGRPPTTASSSKSPLPEPDIDPESCSLEKFKLYETRARFYLIGCDRLKRFFRVLKIDRSERSDLNVSEDPVVYSEQEVKNLLHRISEGNRSTGGLTFVAKVYGIAGCIKFLESYYLIIVTKRKQIGFICGHAIYSIEESQMITVPHSSIQTDISHSKTELRYKKLLSSVDLTKDFFYSYTYPIMRSLQKNVLAIDDDKIPYENMFVWNTFLTEAIRQRCNSTRWTIPLVYGHFKQVRLSIFGREFSICLISRRSRHFAGTRYLKRGVNDLGRVANDVETEQIVLDEAGFSRGQMSSVVQMRGSIPLFWSQETSRFSPKPDIIVQRYDPTYQATKLHFEDLANRYGNPIIILNLIKTVEKRPREMMLRREFANAVGYLNQIMPEDKHLKFIHWDFHKFAKSKSANVLAVLGAVAGEALDLTGFYCSGKQVVPQKRSNQVSHGSTRSNSLDVGKFETDFIDNFLEGNHETVCNSWPRYQEDNNTSPCFQSGVLRTNCIDCLDRTNVAQYAYGLAALSRQLHALGLADVPKIDPDSSIAAALMDMYQSMGDALALQYGGSAAHNTVFPERQGKWKATTQSREFLKSIKRYYSNAYTDGEKQDAINLFLGYFKPQEGKPALWELDSDYYLHVNGITDDAALDNCWPPHLLAAVGAGTKLSPVPACREDFSRLKLTSFDKLLEKTCSSIKNVRLFSESDVKAAVANSGMAPDAAAVQLKSPNWLFGQRKLGDSSTTTSKVTSQDSLNTKSEQDAGVISLPDLSFLSRSEISQDDIVMRHRSLMSSNESSDISEGNLLFDQDESSEIYMHYTEVCQGPAVDLFRDDPDLVKHYEEVSSYDFLSDDTAVRKEMEAALKEYELIGSDLGITSVCRPFADDACRLTRWIIGEENAFDKRI